MFRTSEELAEMREKYAGVLERIKHYKTEYQIGTGDAWQYESYRRAYSLFRDTLVNELERKGIQYKPSSNEVSNAVLLVSQLMEEALQSLGEKRVKELGKGSPRYHSVRTLGSRASKDFPIPDWNADYRGILTRYYQFFEKSKNVDESLRSTFTELLALPIKVLRDPEGKWYSLTDLDQHDEYLVDTEREPDDEFTDEEKEGILDEFRSLGMPDVADAGEALFEKDENFTDWMKGKMNIEEYSDNNPLEGFPFEGPTKYQKQLLFGYDAAQGLYDRARREKTLKRMEVERRIALNAVLDTEGSTIAERIEKASTDFEKGTEEGWAMNMGRENFERKKYTTIAVKKNRRWLENILSIPDSF